MSEPMAVPLRFNNDIDALEYIKQRYGSIDSMMQFWRETYVSRQDADERETERLALVTENLALVEQVRMYRREMDRLYRLRTNMIKQRKAVINLCRESMTVIHSLAAPGTPIAWTNADTIWPSEVMDILEGDPDE